jgi:hypothetical protein
MGFELEIVWVKLGDILELSEVSIKQSAGGKLIVNTEVESGFGYGFEDGLLRRSFEELLGIVAGGAMGSRGMNVESVGLCRGRD